MDEINKQQLFRKEALAELNVSNQLNQRLKITSTWSWVLVIAIATIIICIIGWGFWGTIPTRVQGEGILLASKGGLYNAVAPEGGGRIISFAVKPGDVVTQNQVIAHLDAPDLQAQIEVAKAYLAKLQAEYSSSEAESKKETQINGEQIAAQNLILKNIIVSNTANLMQIKDLLATKTLAFKKGLITKQDVSNTLQNFYDVETSINQAQSSIEDNKIKQENFISDWNDKLKTLRLKVEDQQYQVNDLQVKISSSKEVKSPISGVIIYIQASIGDKVQGGQIVATISTVAKDLDAVIFVPAQNGKRIKNDMNVLISPTIIKREEFGSMRAIVEQISPFPSTPKSMLAILQNADLVKQFSGQGATIAVRVKLIADPSTYSGYAWTSSKGPEQIITAGTLVHALITVQTQRPITLIIPAVKKLLGE